MSLQPCLRPGTSCLFRRGISSQSFLESLGAFPKPDVLPSLAGKSSFRRKIEESSQLLAKNEKEFKKNEKEFKKPPHYRSSLPKPIRFSKIARQLNAVDALLRSFEGASPQDRQQLIDKANFYLRRAHTLVAGRQEKLARWTQSGFPQSAVNVKTSKSKAYFIQSKLLFFTSQLKKAEEDAIGKTKWSVEVARLKVLKAEVALLRLKQTTAQRLGRRERPRPRELTPSEFSKRVDGVLPAVSSAVLEDIQPSEPGRAVARLAHGLDRVLFNPNVYWFQDPHSKVYNFPPTLQKLPAVSAFAFDRVTGFIPSSRDPELATLAQHHGKKFTGSTSSLSGMLSHIYYLISSYRSPDVSTHTSSLSKKFPGFSYGTTAPIRVAFRRSEVVQGVYALDSINDKEDEGKNILTFLGTMLERFLTLPTEAFEKFLKSSDSPPEDNTRREAYRYSKSSKFVMRSQLDCQDVRLPGTGVFDLKTRACIAIRKDRLNWEENAGYQIVKQTGALESFEREYFDLIRSAFLKYQFQVRIGNMDGVFVAYHNTEKFFGFQYIPLAEMDTRLFGSPDAGDKVFQKCVGVLEALADEIVNCFPDETVQCLVEAREPSQFMDVWVYPDRTDPEAPADSRGPIKLLRLEVQHLRNDSPITANEAIDLPSKPWKLRYTIYHSNKSSADLWKSYYAAVERKNMSMYLPNGFTVQDFLKIWHTINYGASGEEFAEVDADPESIPPTSRKFVHAGAAVQQLRRLAQKGRQASSLLDSKAKVQWGENMESTFETFDSYGHIIFQNSESSTTADESKL